MSYSDSTSNKGFRSNKLLESWKTGKPTLNGWLAIPSPVSAEAMAHAGWDSLTMDMQHGLIDYSQAVPMLMAISTTNVVPIVRVPWLEEGIIMKMLDAGAYGIICPMINNKEQAERFAAACRYAPQGSRSFGPIRAKMYAGNDYHKYANENVLSIAMIETKEALENLDSILEVNEISGIYIGPSDLSLALGYAPGFDQEVPEVLAAIKHIIKSAKQKEKWVGIHNGSVDYAHRMIQIGADFVTIGSDMRLMTNGANQLVKDFKMHL